MTLQSIRQCIFCDYVGRLTREHVWAKWLHPYLNIDPSSGYVSAAFHVHPGDVTELVHKKKHGGDPRSRAVHQVCAQCNNTWMSALQREVKPVLLPMLLGEQTRLCASEQRILAAWITMAAMVGEHFHPDVVVTPQAERQAFAAAPEPRANWKIWIGTYERRDWSTHLGRLTRPLLFHGDPQPPPVILPSANTQATTFVVGKVWVHLFSCPSPELVALVGLTLVDTATRKPKIAQLWPHHEDIGWPLPEMTDHEARMGSRVIFDRIDYLHAHGLFPFNGTAPPN